MFVESVDRKKGWFAASLMSAASAIVLVSAAPSAYAQDTQVDEAGDVVIATGIRQSLKNALDEKRNAKNIIDGISAEDIGKSSDQNIAEALQRVSGVSINRENGEGTTVTVRGVNADLNNVTLNGVTLTSSGGDLSAGQGNQGVDFSAFSADILSRIEVAKTSSADQDEGSLGAAINLRTFKPLSARKDRRVLDVQARYNEFFRDKSAPGADDLTDDYRASISLSEKFADDTIGVSLVAITEKNSVRQDFDQVTRYFAMNPNNPFTPGNFRGLPRLQLPGGITNVETGELISTFDYGDGQGERRVRAHAPFEKQYQIHKNVVKRDSLTGSIQYQPTDRTDIQLDATFTETEREQNQFQYRIRPQNNPEGFENLFNPETFDVVGYRQTANFDLQGSGNTNPKFVRPAEFVRDTTDENLVLSLDANHEVGNFSFNLRGGMSDTNSRDDDAYNITYQLENQPDNNGNRPGSFNGFLRDRTAANTVPGIAAGIVTDTGHAGFFSGYDCPTLSLRDVCPIVVSAENVANYNSQFRSVAQDPDVYSFGSLNLRDRKVDDTNYSLFFDVDYDKAIGPISSVEAGFKWNKRDRNQRQTNLNFNRFNGPVGSLFGLPLSEFSTGETTPQDFGRRLGLPANNVGAGLPLADGALLLARLEQEQEVPRVINNPANQREFVLDIWAAYAKVNFEVMDGRLFGDVGLRYAHTDTRSTQGGGIILQNANFTQTVENSGGPDANFMGGFFGSQAAAEAALGIDLLGTQDPGYVAPPPPEQFIIRAENTYSNFLPSLNVNFLAQEDIMLRFAASKTIARPPFDQLRPGFNFQEAPFNNATTLTLGNPNLDPFESTNLDVSAEWYFDDNSLFSVALFNKSLNSFSRGATSLAFFADPRDFLYDANGAFLPEGQINIPTLDDLLLPFSDTQPANCLPNREFDYNSLNGPAGCELVNLVSLENGDGGYIRGAEVSFQTNFTDLPGILGNTGITANYTYADSETDENRILNTDGELIALTRSGPLANTSLHTFNGTIFYEDDGKQLRLAYNTRSDYLVNSAQIGGYSVYAEGGESLDLSGGVSLSSKLRLNFSAANLLDDVFRTYAVVNSGEFDRVGTDFESISVQNPLPREELTLGDQPTHRTLRRSNTGRIFRVGLRYEF